MYGMYVYIPSCCAATNGSFVAALLFIYSLCLPTFVCVNLRLYEYVLLLVVACGVFHF